MEFTQGDARRADTIIGLFTDTFTASDGAEEGRLIGTLVAGLLSTTAPEDLHVICASEGDALAGAIVFTRLDYAQDLRRVVLLSPVAVALGRQGRGVGQALLRHGLAQVAEAGADVAITYGDPRFYARVGFHPLSVAEAAPPHPLSQPEGWLGQSLTNAALTPLAGPSHCAPALDDPAYW